MSTKRKWLDIDEIESGTGTARETGPAARRMAGGRAGGWISIDALEPRGEQQGAALLRLAGEVAARQKQEAAREAQSSPMERLASEMAADRQERARRTASAPQRASGYLTGGGQSAVRPSYGLPAGTVSAPMQAKQQARQMRETALAAQLSQAPKYPRGMTEMNDTAAEYQANHAPALSRIAAGAKSIGHSLAGSVPALAELAGQYDANRRADLANPERQTLLKENEMLSNRLTAIRQGYGNAAWGSEADIRAQMDANTRRLRGELRASDTASPDGFGMRQMRRSAEQQEQALAGMTGAPRFLAGTGLSIANNAPALAAGAVLGPAASMALMGAQAAASKGYELNERGLSPEESLVRGLASGGIEALTEKYSIEGLLDIAKGTGAKTAVKNLLRQMGVEASEESASYALNYLTDKLARDPEAVFSLAELAESAAGGALSGGVYGGVGLALNRLGTNGQKNYQFLKERDGGKTPDFDAQHAHYYNAARSGMALERIPAYPSGTPLDGTARQAAAFAGQNDGLSEAAETVQKLMDGKAVSDTALDRALSFPETRKALAEQAGTLPGASSQARKAVRDWAAARKQETPVKQPARQRAPSGKRFRGIAEDVLSTYESTADTTEISEDLRELYEALNTPGEAALATNLRQTATGIARKILQRGVPEADELSGQYADLRKYLRTTPVTLSSADRASVPDGYETFRKRNMGRLRLVNEGGTPVDAMYQQLQADYGEGFFPANITHPADQLEQIGKVLADVRPKAGNAYASESAVHDLALDLIGRCAALPQRLQTAESNARKPAGAVGAAAGMAGEQRAPGLAETEVSRKLKADDREFLDTLFQAVGLRGAIVSQTSDTANAQIENGVVTVYANADDAASAYRGTVRHEVTHQIKALGAEHYQAFEDFAVSARAARDGVSVESLVESTRETYRTLAGQELTDAQAREELAGDFAMLLDVDTDTVRRFVNQGEQSRRTAKGILQTIRDIIDRIRERFANRKLSQEQRDFLRQMQEGEKLWAEALGEASRIANKNTAQTDGGTRYSIKRTADGSQYVEVDTDILEGVEERDIPRILADIVQNKFHNLIMANGQQIAVSSKSTREWIRSRSADALRRENLPAYMDKVRAFYNADELLTASRNYINENLRHARRDSFISFARGVVNFQFGESGYSADVIVGIAQNGKATLYDLVNIEKMDTPYTAAPATSEFDRRHGVSVDTSITDSKADVNKNLPTRFSLKNADEAITRLAKYREQYGTLPRGEMAVRDILFPQQTDEYTRVRRFSRTAAESASLTDEQADAIGAAVAEGWFNYEPVGDRAARNYAETMLGRGADAAAEAWARVVNRDGRASKNDIALGEYLLREAAKQGDTERVVQLTAEIAAEGTRAGQVVQAMRLLKQLDGAGQLVSLDAMLKKLQGDLDKGKSGVFLQVPDELRQELAGAKGEAEVNAALDKIYTELARQMPTTWADKWNAWRYLSMLGNPRTHIRNILGNAAFEPAILVKNTIGAALERVFVPQGERTKSLSGLLPGTGGKARKFARADFKEMKDIITGGGKMNPTDIIRERQRVFKNNTLEWVRKQNFNFLEAEDGIFLEHHYVRAMTQYLKANKVDVDTLDPNSKEGARLLNRARDYAVREAQKATYRDFSLTAQTISRASNRAGKFGQVVIEGVLPFKKTPINVLKRGVEYSPIGLANTLTRGVARVVSGKISANEFIDSLSAGLTGTGIAALGWLLASTGVLSGGGDDDKEQEFRDALGAQSWALRFGDKTYTIDWLAPSSMPLFVGAETLRLYENGMELNGRSIYDAAMTIAEPLTQMSMLDGLNSMLSSVRYGENPLSDLLTGAVTDYISQAVPTLFGQIARTVDPVRRTTYDDKNIGVPSIVQKTVQKNANKIPFLSQQSAAYLDIWGREQFGGSVAERALQNFISPGYLKNEKLSDMENELIRLYQATGEGGALPGRAAKSFQVQEETVYLNAGAYRLFAETRGTMMYSGLSEMTASSGYQALPDVDKAKAVGNMIQLSNAVAKTSVSDYELTGWYQKAVDAQERCGIPLPTYVLAYSAQSGLDGFKDKDGETIDNSKGLRQMQAIYQIPGLNDKQRAYLFEACNVGKSVRHYNKAKVEQELKKMEQQAAK